LPTYLANKPHDEFRSVYPLGQIDWEDAECVADGVCKQRLL
jgi:hypothetical protein